MVGSKDKPPEATAIVWVRWWWPDQGPMVLVGVGCEGRKGSSQSTSEHNIDRKHRCGYMTASPPQRAR